MSALYYFGIIEGVVHSRGEDAFPVKFWQALKMIGEELGAPKGLLAEHVQSANVSRASVQIRDEIALIDVDDTDVVDIQEDIDLKGYDTKDITAVLKKPRKEWSPEAKAAARERALARGLGKRKESDSTLEAISPPPIPVSRSAGPRSSIGDIKDSDWADIKRMRANGLPDNRIASSFDVEVDYLQRFCDRMLLAEHERTRSTSVRSSGSDQGNG